MRWKVSRCMYACMCDFFFLFKFSSQILYCHSAMAGSTQHTSVDQWWGRLLCEPAAHTGQYLAERSSFYSKFYQGFARQSPLVSHITDTAKFGQFRAGSKPHPINPPRKRELFSRWNKRPGYHRRCIPTLIAHSSQTLVRLPKWPLGWNHCYNENLQVPSWWVWSWGYKALNQLT